MTRGILAVALALAFLMAVLPEIFPAFPAQTRQVEGTVQAVSLGGDMIKLSDGTALTIPASVHVDVSQLKPGAMVKASYQEQAGQKVVTNIVVTPGPEKR